MQASQRLDRFGAEVFASLNNKLLALKAQGKTIYNMSVGTPDFKPYDHVVEALTQAAQNPEMWKYSLRDLPELKQAVCDYYERRFGVSGITPSMVQSCNGTQEGVGHLGLALLDPGDTILVPDPCYPVFEAGAKIADAKLEYYPLVAEHNYLPYVAGIDPEVADRAKYMIVSLPANPVGSVGTPEVYEEIIAFAREHDLLIVHDNAYSDIVFDGEPGGSFLQYPGALEVGVEFFSLSKSFNVTGARIGFLVGREDVVSAFDNGLLILGSLDVVPDLDGVQTLLGELGIALHVVDADNVGLDLVAHLHDVLGLGGGIVRQLAQLDVSCLLGAHVHLHLSGGDGRDNAGDRLSCI